jgi:hypothetical protein
MMRNGSAFCWHLSSWSCWLASRSSLFPPWSGATSKRRYTFYS